MLNKGTFTPSTAKRSFRKIRELLARISLFFSMEERLVALLQDTLDAKAPEENKKAYTVGAGFGYSLFMQFAMYGLIFFMGGVFLGKGIIDSPMDVMNVLFPLIFAASGMGQAAGWAVDQKDARRAAQAIFTLVDTVPSIDVYSDEGQRPSQLRAAEGADWADPPRASAEPDV